MYYLLRLAGTGSSFPRVRAAGAGNSTHVVKALGNALSCTTQGRLFDPWCLTAGSLYFVIFGRSAIAFIILVSTSCEACSLPSSVSGDKVYVCMYVCMYVCVDARTPVLALRLL